MDKQSWKHGKEITSEEEYNEQTSALAEELQRLYTPAQVAEIAAQHMIYVDVLNSKPPMDKGFHSISDALPLSGGAESSAYIDVSDSGEECVRHYKNGC